MRDINDLKVFSTDANAISWLERPNLKNGMSSYSKILHLDEETGMRVNLGFYPKGIVAEHGATAETDVLTLFITNKLFDIEYKD